MGLIVVSRIVEIFSKSLHILIIFCHRIRSSQIFSPYSSHSKISTFIMFLEPGSSLFSLLVRHQYGCHYAWWCRLVSVLTDTIGGGYLGLSSLPATVHVLPGHSNIHSRPRPIKIETFFNIISTYPSV